MHVVDLELLARRMGRERLERRLAAQVDAVTNLRGHGEARFHFEHLPFAGRLVRWTFRASGLAGLGRRNALALRLSTSRLELPRLASAFSGLRVLHLSDLHLDGNPGLAAVVARALEGLRFDVAVVTGDFRFHETGRFAHLERELAPLAPLLACAEGAYAVLGNHDVLEMVPMLERLGIRVLLNEAVTLTRGTEQLSLLGVDDPHFYGEHDVAAALAQAAPVGSRVLLAHSPEIAGEAAQAGIDLYLAGHTHGGQVCLPGGVPVVKNARCRRARAAGLFRVGSMVGYTSRGVGSSGVFARFFCPPEVAIHELVAPGAPQRRK